MQNAINERVFILIGCWIMGITILYVISSVLFALELCKYKATIKRVWLRKVVKDEGRSSNLDEEMDDFIQNLGIGKKKSNSSRKWPSPCV